MGCVVYGQGGRDEIVAFVYDTNVLKDIAINSDNINVTKEWSEVLAMSYTTLRATVFRCKGSLFVLIVVRNSGLDPVRDFMVFLSMYFYKRLVCYISSVRHLHEHEQR